MDAVFPEADLEAGRRQAAPELFIVMNRGSGTAALRTLTVGARNARRLKVATDGEVQWMELPLRFTVAPRPLRVMLPPPEQRLAAR